MANIDRTTAYNTTVIGGVFVVFGALITATANPAGSQPSRAGTSPVVAGNASESMGALRQPIIKPISMPIVGPQRTLEQLRDVPADFLAQIDEALKYENKNPGEAAKSHSRGRVRLAKYLAVSNSDVLERLLRDRNEFRELTRVARSDRGWTHGDALDDRVVLGSTRLFEMIVIIWRDGRWYIEATPSDATL